MPKNGKLSTKHMEPTDRITVLTRKNPYGEPLATRRNGQKTVVSENGEKEFGESYFYFTRT